MDALVDLSKVPAPKGCRLFYSPLSYWKKTLFPVSMMPKPFEKPKLSSSFFKSQRPQFPPGVPVLGKLMFLSDGCLIFFHLFTKNFPTLSFCISIFLFSFDFTVCVIKGKQKNHANMISGVAKGERQSWSFLNSFFVSACGFLIR